VAAYLARRLLFAAFLVFTVSSAALVLTRLAPGDYSGEVFGIGADPEAVAALRARFGLDESIGAQYARWLSRVVRFDFGRSLAFDRPVNELIPARARNTAILAITALLVATLVGIPLGIVTGSRRGGALAGIVRAISVLLVSMPPLLTSVALVFLAARTGWLPVGGMDSARHMIVPVLALALPLAAMFERLQAQAMHEVVGQPFMIATVARGVPQWRVIWRDGLKAAMKPVASVYGLIVGTLLSGSFAVEIVTTWPGLGQLMLTALRARDVYLVAGCAAVGSIFLAVGTFVSDAALAFVDPRTTE
jgi:ABC-type dipeptide/oligopeptide/nickel transport system permease component